MSLNGVSDRDPIRLSATAAQPAAVIVAALRLETLPTLAGRPVYFAMRRSFGGSLPAAGGAATTLKLMVDPGTGVWQNSTAWGLECDRDVSADCVPAGAAPTAHTWGMRVYPATLAATGVAKFGIELSSTAGGSSAAAAEVNISGVVIAGIGARYHSM